jgi:predicted small secreted protein
MQIFRTGSALLGAVLLLSAVGAAQVESTPVPANTKPDFSQMMFLTGSWTCNVMSARRPGPYRVTSTSTVSPDGYWIVTKSTIHKTSWIPNDFASEDRMTYDASTSRWVDIAMDEQGGYDLSTSPGWSGDTIVWTDVAYPKTNATTQSYPTTITKISETETNAVNSFKEPGGRVVSVRTHCTKTT